MPVQEFARLDGAVNLSVITNATPEEFALSAESTVFKNPSLPCDSLGRSHPSLRYSTYVSSVLRLLIKFDENPLRTR